MPKRVARRRSKSGRRDPVRRISTFYEPMSSLDTIRSALAHQGVDPDAATARDLWSRGLDVQNLGGFPVLETLAAAVEEYAAPKPGEPLLDVACGLGGPGRYLAERYDCHVTGIDLVPLRVEIARALAKMVGMAERVTYRVGDATALPFRRGEFSQVWMLDASIHVREKAKLFRELARVLMPGGLLVLHDMPGPLPRSMSAVTRRAPYFAPRLPHLLRQVEDAGLRLLTWRDTTPRVLEDFEAKRAAVEQADRSAEHAPADVRRRLAQGRAALYGYLDALRTGMGCGFLIARR